jgi:N-acetylglucosamine kinase-like BadF-type ATPase
MSTSTLLLGVDGGGTTTVAWLVALGGRVLGRGQAGPSNAKAVGAQPARAALASAIGDAYADAGLEPAPAEVACLGLAGFDRPDDRQMLRAWLDESDRARRLVLVNDGDLVVAAGTPDGWGIGVIAGTGSIAVGRTLDGRTARAGGWGHLIGDEGSAYDVVLASLRLVARRADGREPGTDVHDPLTVRMCRELKAETPASIVPALYAPGMDRTRIAALAPTVLEAVAADPALVDRLLRPAGVALAEQAVAVARCLGWTSGALPLALAGGFLLSAPDVSRALVDGLTRAGYEVTASPVPEPVRGAVVLAERALRAG